MFHRHFYVSRGHNNVQATGASFPLDNGQSLVLFSSRTSTDLVTGFGGSAKKAMGSRIMGGKLAKNFAKYRTLSEGKDKKDGQGYYRYEIQTNGPLLRS